MLATSKRASSADVAIRARPSNEATVLGARFSASEGFRARSSNRGTAVSGAVPDPTGCIAITAIGDL
jgi:hypothetical protein